MFLANLAFMQEIFLSPHQVIASNWPALHNLKMLQAYFLLCKEGLSQKLPPVAVMPIDALLPLLNSFNLKRFYGFSFSHPEAKYVLFDGSHRATAANLSGALFPVVVINTQDDLEEMKVLSAQGRVFQYTLGDNAALLGRTLETIRQGKAENFNQTRFFWTVAEKTKKLLEEGHLPKYMTTYYEKNMLEKGQKNQAAYMNSSMVPA